MSCDLYAELLVWNGATGLAKFGGVQVALSAWPPGLLSGLRVSSVRFMPEIRDCQVELGAQGWRELERDEKAALHAWLQRVAAAARAAINEQGSTT